MSVTFSLDRESNYPYPSPDLCPKCGGAAWGEPRADRECARCDGYGGDREAWLKADDLRAEREGEFNVANTNARFILSELLNVSTADGLYGSLDAGTAAIRLATSAYKTADGTFGVREASETQSVRVSAEGVSLGPTVVDCGRSADQVVRYVEALERLVEIAQSEGCGINWG
jgi:hypothetical protein